MNVIMTSPRLAAEAVALLEDAGALIHYMEPFPPPEAIAALARKVGAVAILSRQGPVTASVMDAAPTLRVVARHGVGVDDVDVAEACRRGIAAYIETNNIDLMFGCASLNGTDPDLLAAELTYLYGHHLAPPALRPKALPERYVEMRRLDPAAYDPRRANQSLPPLIKGYLRLGGFVGDGAVIDSQFNTVDVAIVVKTDLVTERYSKHYERRSQD